MTTNRKSACTGLVLDDHYLQHDTGGGHPENAGRLQAVYGMLETCEYRPRCRLLSPRPCSDEELALVHAQGYIAKIEATANRPFASLGGGYAGLRAFPPGGTTGRGRHPAGDS